MENEWADPNELEPGSHRQAKLTSEQIARIIRLHTIFGEVDPNPIENWIDNFQRDLNPNSELAIWESMAEAFESFSASRSLSLDAKKDVYQVILLRSGAPAEEVIGKLELKVLNERDAKEIMNRYPVNG